MSDSALIDEIVMLRKRCDKLTTAGKELDDLVVAWMNGPLLRLGVHWKSDELYPPALRKFRDLLAEIEESR